ERFVTAQIGRSTAGRSHPMTAGIGMWMLIRSRVPFRMFNCFAMLSNICITAAGTDSLPERTRLRENRHAIARRVRHPPTPANHPRTIHCVQNWTLAEEIGRAHV